MQGGVLLGVRKAGRSRPPAPLRYRTVGTSQSVWTQMHYLHQHKKQESNLAEDKVPRLAYNSLYHWFQARTLLTTGCMGPLELFGLAMAPLFIAFVPTKTPQLHFPRSWRIWDVTRQIYNSATLIPQRFSSWGLQIAARSCLDKITFEDATFDSQAVGHSWGSYR